MYGKIHDPLIEEGICWAKTHRRMAVQVRGGRIQRHTLGPTDAGWRDPEDGQVVRLPRNYYRRLGVA